MKKNLLFLTLLSTIALADSLIESFEGQVRVGYIDTKEDKSLIGTALGGHIFLKTRPFYHMAAALEFYTIQDIGKSQNPDFFDADLNGFTTLSQAYAEAEWENSFIRAGRQLLDTPHADSDDIRMMPNYFFAYLLQNSSLTDITLQTGKIERMAGWENGVDAKRFVRIDEVLGLDKKSDGVYFASALYEKEPYALQVWYYDVDEVCDIFYLEVGSSVEWKGMELDMAFQYDRAKKRGEALLGDIDAKTFGVSLQADVNSIRLYGAYNKENGSGAVFSLGGGPFFTSMEDLTIDAIGAKGSAWTAVAGLDFWEYFSADAMYGRFKASKSSLFDASEVDFTLSYSYNDSFSVDMVHADVDDRSGGSDRSIFRVIANYNF